MHKQELFACLAHPLELLQQACHMRTYPLGPIQMKKCGYHQWDRLGEVDGWEPFDETVPFGGKDSHYLFRTTLVFPDEARDKQLWCSVSTGATDIWNYNNPQFFVYLDRTLVCGLDVRHTEFPLGEVKTKELGLYAYVSTAKSDVFLFLNVYAYREEVEQLCIDLRLAKETLVLLEEESAAYLLLSKACQEALLALDLRQLEGALFEDSVLHARQILAAVKIPPSPLEVGVVGHSHIDMAWLWEIKQTREKAIRSYATVLHLMELYPEYRYMASQMQLLEFVRQDQPALFAQILQRVKEGRWEIEGGMWVESDTILTSGESLVRQIFWGKRWILQMTGTESKVLWLPDCFGFPATLPQIMVGCNLSYFVTSKLGWNEKNRFPHDLFTWSGLDGSSVLAYLITSQEYERPSVYPKMQGNETTYNGLLTPSQILGTWQRFQDKDKSTKTLHLYGYGDGGGGPTAGMLAYQRRLSQGYGGLPVTKQTTVKTFLREVEQALKEPASWYGELYLEYHRGTYTTMAENKRLNRLCEMTAMEGESLATFAWLFGLSGYPHDSLETAWKLVLLNQFHDILPGSSIKEVYVLSHEQLHQALTVFKETADKARNLLLAHMEASFEEVVVFNPVCRSRSEIVSFSLDEEYGIVDGQGKALVSWYDGSSLHFLASDLPEKGWKTYRLVAEKKSFSLPFEYSEGTLSTPFYELEVSKDLTLFSLFDKSEGREVLKAGTQGNVLRLYADYPEKYDAWNLGKQESQRSWAIEGEGHVEVRACNPLYCTLLVKRTYLKSTYVQTMTCYAYDRRIDFTLDIDWREDHLLLRSLFEVDVYAPCANYQIAYGVCERTTHTNTSWDEAAFEVSSHGWVDLSEEGYGVALLSSQSYGYSAKKGVLSVSLLRSPTFPNPEADRGQHHFSYSLLPHVGRYQEGLVVDAGYALQQKSMALRGCGGQGVFPREFTGFSVLQKNIIGETVKKAEDRSSVLLRLIEMHGQRGLCTVHSDFRILEAWECNLLEERLCRLEAGDHQVEFLMKAHQIKTLELVCELGPYARR